MIMNYILGIDIGTGSAKAVAVGKTYAALETTQCFYPTSSPYPGYSEQDPEVICNALASCVREMVGKLGTPPAAISLSSAMHSVIPVDQNGLPLAPMMTWADNRSSLIADRLLAAPAGASLYQLTGTPVHSMSPLCKIIWIRENLPDVFSRVYKFISIKEYIWHRLFGSFEIDHSIASCTGLMEVRRLEWCQQALAAAGITAAYLSELVPTDYSRRGHRCAALSFLPADTLFVIGGSDGCMANLGTGAIQPGNAALTIGTSGALRVAGNQAILHTAAMTFSYRLDEEIFINGGPVNNGGAALKWFLKNSLNKEELTEADYRTAFEAVASVPAGASGLLFLPYLQGERAPIWDTRSCGTFFGIRIAHQTAHFTRAVVEGICFALNDVLQSLVLSGQQIDLIHVSGGFVSSPVWLQILADITGRDLLLASTQDASALGAAFIAFKIIGKSQSYPLPDTSAQIRIRPDAQTHILYQRYFRLYKQLYLNLKDVMADLYRLEQESSSAGPD